MLSQLPLASVLVLVDLHEPEATATGYLVFTFGDGTTEAVVMSRRARLIVDAMLTASKDQEGDDNAKSEK